ncbi:MAG: alpha/beta hydrolase [Burkholderiaceae bacterium]|nr:alpha/beta hydrolase [Burkholderiaceae bacterium]
MLIPIAAGTPLATRLFVDVEGPAWVPDGPALREKPTLIVLHGGPGYDHSGFKPAFSALADLCQIVYLDHRGHGRSERRPSHEWTLDCWADDVVRVCDTLGITRPIVLGQSFGGFVAQRYLARHPDHPAKVVLSSTSAAMNLERKLAMFERLGGPLAREAARGFWTAPNADTWAAYQQACMALYNTNAAVRGDPQARARTIFHEPILFHFAGGEMQAMDLAPGLAAARCPVLVMAGTQDPVCPLADARDIFDALPAEWRQWAEFTASGHGAWRDEPEAAFAALRRFIVQA